MVFADQGLQVQAPVGSTLLDAAVLAGASVPHACLGNCACLSCCVHVLSGILNLSAMEEPEQQRLKLAGALPTCVRLACQALVLRGRVVLERLEPPRPEW